MLTEKHFTCSRIFFYEIKNSVYTIQKFKIFTGEFKFEEFRELTVY